MTLQELQAANRRRQEITIGAWNKTPSGKTADLLDNYKQAYQSISSDLEKTYSRVLSGIEPDKYYSTMTQYNRLANLQKSVASDYVKAARAAGKEQFAISELALSNMYYENQYAVNWFTPKGYFTALDQKVMEVAVYGTEEIWRSITPAKKVLYEPYLPQYGYLNQLLAKNATLDLEKINIAITQGLRKGEGYAPISRELRKIFNTTGYNALRIARTEGNRLLNSGAFAQSQAAAAAGVNMQRMYLATQDMRTRDQSGAMDGQKRPIDKPFNYGGTSWFIPGNSGVAEYDCNDRCSTIDIVDNKPPELRRGRNPVTGQTEVTSFNSFDDWMEQHNLTRNNSGRIIHK